AQAQPGGRGAAANLGRGQNLVSPEFQVGDQRRILRLKMRLCQFADGLTAGAVHLGQGIGDGYAAWQMDEVQMREVVVRKRLSGWILQRIGLGCREADGQDRLDYQPNGTSRCRTRCWYSVYRGRFLARKRSSSKSRHSRNGSMAASGTNPQYEPSASGVPSK